ncbi:MAG TPA: GNAT family N-acetyltransferase [Methanothrix sp.]|nr:GNAT family N-acetyltransferase [Methanothrix sp.]HPT19164.1 GNAT family N-acetyltransferase [Methanothrix sp.]
MNEEKRIEVILARSWLKDQIVDLYRAGGWWTEEMDPSRIGDLMQASFAFALAIDISTGRAVGMGRVISDGMADAYVQDLVVLEEWRSSGVGRMILRRLLEECRNHKLTWIALIAEPGKEDFYRSMGFRPMPGHVPMILSGEEE